MDTIRIPEKKSSGGTLSWETVDSPQGHGTDWFWAAGISTASITATAAIFGSVLFAVLLFLFGVTLMLHAGRKPQAIAVNITPKGIGINKSRYSYENLRAFSLHKNRRGDTLLILETGNILEPHLTIPLNGIKPVNVRGALATHLPETPYKETLTGMLLEYLGF